MTPLLDTFLIVNNEEEQLAHCLDSYTAIADLMGICSIVDNNSTDATLDIIETYKDRIPIVLQHHRENNHHGEMRTKAISKCKLPWIFYLDADETTTNDFRKFLLSDKYAGYGQVRFYKITTHLDKFHYWPDGNGYTQRLFRNLNGVHFPQSIHTEPVADFSRTLDVPPEEVLLFDHTAMKSPEALWAKGVRYQWAARINVPGIGPAHEYAWRVWESFNQAKFKEFAPEIKSRISWGPEKNYGQPSPRFFEGGGEASNLQHA